MKIVEVELLTVHPHIRAWNREAHALYHDNIWETRTVIVLKTDTGLEGLAEVVGEPDQSLKNTLDRLIGTHPATWLASREIVIGLAPAIYDLVGKANDIPAYHLFGPKVRSWIPVSHWTVSQTPARMAEEVRQAAEMGHTWMKYHTCHLHNVIDQTEAMQAVAPRGFKIHYDVNFDNTVESIVGLDRALSKYPVAGLIEDPLRTHDMTGYRLLRQKCVLPIVFHHAPLGGREVFLEAADAYMLGHADVGVTVAAAGLFEGANVPFMTQNVGGTITQAFVAHMAAAFEMATLHHVTGAWLWEDDVVSTRFDVVGGHIRVPETPGLGIALDRDAIARLQAQTPIQLPKALARITCQYGPVVYARPPISRNPLWVERDVPGVGDGYERLVDQDYWYDDGSARFADLWERAGKGVVIA
ncbi:MAG: hypothetical protein FJY97_18040 [candidate division Zixibacteria bacterium]|nr:hypothetical protein [candidate division Zixibacteria bacterium]